MSIAGVDSARALATYVDELAEDLAPHEWNADSACHGWRVQDVIGHMAFFLNFIADPSLSLPDNPAGTAERLNDAAVRERADWTPVQTVDYYRTQAETGIAALEALQQEDQREATVEMLDLGTYRLAQLSDAVTFDHLVHLTCDILTPHGPIDRKHPDLRALTDPAIDWMIAGLPHMCGTALQPVLISPVGLHLHGATDRTVVLSPDPDGGVVTSENTALPDDVAHSDATEFLRWGTTRSAWRSVVTTDGDHAAVAAVLDAIDIV